MSERLRIALTGPNGRMGTVLAHLISADSDLELAGGIGRGTLDAAREVLRSADVVIDFSAPTLLSTLLDEHRDSLAGRAVVVGTTGLDATVLDALATLATLSPVLCSANFSVGVNLLAALVEQAARVLGDEYDAEIVETHHRRKTDAPSGTALELARAWPARPRPRTDAGASVTPPRRLRLASPPAPGRPPSRPAPGIRPGPARPGHGPAARRRP